MEGLEQGISTFSLFSMLSHMQWDNNYPRSSTTTPEWRVFWENCLIDMESKTLSRLVARQWPSKRTSSPPRKKEFIECRRDWYMSLLWKVLLRLQMEAQAIEKELCRLSLIFYKHPKASQRKEFQGFWTRFRIFRRKERLNMHDLWRHKP